MKPPRERTRARLTAAVGRWGPGVAVRYAQLCERARRRPRPSTRTITIRFDHLGLCRVPSTDGEDGGAYYTYDRKDARETARAIYGEPFASGITTTSTRPPSRSTRTFTSDPGCRPEATPGQTAGRPKSQVHMVFSAPSWALLFSPRTEYPRKPA